MRYAALAKFLLTLAVASSFIYADKIPRFTIFKIMSNYKKMFGEYVLVNGKKAEQEGDEFILEALPLEADLLKDSYNPKNFKAEDLFLNIRVDDSVMLNKLKKVTLGSKVLLLIEIREQTVYNKIIPVFVLHDYEVLSQGSGLGSAKEDTYKFETYEDKSDSKTENKEQKKPRRKIRIRRKGSK